MQNLKQKPEIVVPTGNMEKLKVAVSYGADAVYLGGKEFSLRKASDNFSQKELECAISWAHKSECKVYTTINIFPREKDLAKIADFLQFLGSTNVDGIIISDLGVFELAKENAPNIPIHVSTQANVTNSKSAKFWKKLGASRIVLARECSIDEIRKIKEKVDIDLEVFAHGAMCISYSGRCLLSLAVTNRDANRGNCSHPCRWKYHVTEEKRPGMFFPVEEDDRGTYLFNSKDICLLKHLDMLIDAGVSSFKIEGRTKGMYYVGTTTRIYKAAVKKIMQREDSEDLNNFLEQELETINNRGYCSGFLFGTPGLEGSDFEKTKYAQKSSFVGTVGKISKQKFWITTKSKFFINDLVTVLCQDRNNNVKIHNHTGKIDLIQGENGDILSLAQPNQKVLVKISGYNPAMRELIRIES